ncbi:MAG: hypothetical protein EKK56_00930 [Flavobacteriaceae bacterium]|nr:MAG: hypothetical protein EKK56_00930 [Flavobacteriaceae bacterium]
MSSFFGYTFTDDSTFASTSALQAADVSLFRNGDLAVVTDVGVYQYFKQANSGDLAADGGGYWNTFDEPYLIMNSSNVIDGSQIGNVTDISLSAGTAAAPSLNFSADTNTGLYNPSANVLGISCNGAVVATVTTSAINLASGKVLQVNSVQVVGARATGWVAPTGAATTNQSAINTGTITATDGNVQALAQWINGIQQALTTHGLIGA